MRSLLLPLEFESVHDVGLLGMLKTVFRKDMASDELFSVVSRARLSGLASADCGWPSFSNGIANCLVVTRKRSRFCEAGVPAKESCDEGEDWTLVLRSVSDSLAGVFKESSCSWTGLRVAVVVVRDEERGGSLNACG